MTTRPPAIIANGERWVAVLHANDGWHYAIPGSCILTSTEHLARQGGRYEDGDALTAWIGDTE